MIVEIKLAAALICFSGQCHAALVGKDTPLGEFDLSRRMVLSEGYGGDVLMFAEDLEGVFAIHRVWNGRPSEGRSRRMSSSNTADRRGVTRGCVNVTPAVYDMLVDCCSNAKVVITP